MSRRIIPTILDKGQGFSETGTQPSSWSLMVGCHGACGCVTYCVDVSQQVCIEVQVPLEVDLSAILDPVGSNRYLSCPLSMLFF